MMIGKTISHYKIVEKLGEGGMGVVYKAKDLKLERFVALKFLPPLSSQDEEAKERFIHEAQAASTLQHENICTIHEISETDEIPNSPVSQIYMCMDYYEGETLQARLQKGPIEKNEAIDLIIQVSEGLFTAHNKGIIHRDIKPANIFITNEGVVKILDFGLARSITKETRTQMGTTMGTIAYMSPEQTKGTKVDYRTDIWSLAVMLYEMLSGKLPFKGEYEQAILYSILNEDPEPLKKIPAELDEIIKKCLAKEPDKRYKNIGNVITDITKVREGANINESSVLDKFLPKSLLFRGSLILLLIFVLIFVGSNFIVLKKSGKDIANRKINIAVLSAENLTGNESLNHLSKVIPNLLITDLQQIKFVRVLSWEWLADLNRQLGNPSTTFYDENFGFEICNLDTIDALIVLSFAKGGEIFTTDLKVLDARTKEIIISSHSKGEGIESLFSQVDELSNEISKSLGVSVDKFESVKLRLIDVTTESLEAYSSYIQGMERAYQLQWDEAYHHYLDAVKKDSTFAAAYYWLSFCNMMHDDHGNRKEMIKKAYKYSDRVSRKEKLKINAVYSAAIEGNYDKSRILLEKLINDFPEDKLAYVPLFVIYKNSFDHKHKIEKLFEKLIKIDPYSSFALNGLAYTYAKKGNKDKALEYIDRYIEAHPHEPNPYDTAGEIYFLFGDIKQSIESYLTAVRIKPEHEARRSLSYLLAMNEEYDKALENVDISISLASTLGSKTESLRLKAFYLTWLGRFKDADKTQIEILKNAEQLKIDDMQLRINMMKFWQNYYIGYYEKSLYYLHNSYNYKKEIYPEDQVYTEYHLNLFTALINLNNGNTKQIENSNQIVDSIYIDIDDNVSEWHEYYYNLYKSEYFLKKGEIKKSINTFNENKLPPFRGMYPVQLERGNMIFRSDVLARAYLSISDTDAAIETYKEFLKFKPKSNDRRLIFPLYYYQIANLYEKTGDVENAIVSYMKFLNIWENADDDLKVIDNAKRRLKILRYVN